jgi:hypothetical protein
MFHAKTKPRRATGQAQSMVEFALTAPLLLMLVVGIIELGILFALQIGLANSAREGARAAAVYRYTGAAPLSGDSAAVTTIDSARQLSMSEAITETLSPLVPSGSLTVTVSYPPFGLGVPSPLPAELAADPYRAGDTISVTLEYRHTLFWGILGERDLLLQAAGAARIEPGAAR